MSLRHNHLKPAAAAVLAALLLSACSSEGGGDWSTLLDMARKSWEGQRERVALTEAAAIPFATLGVRIGDTPEQVTTLATDSGGQQLWTSSARIAVTTSRGRIVATSGFQKNLTGYSAPDSNSQWLTPHAFSWSADFADLGSYSVRIVCTDTPAAQETISILGADFDTVRVEEACHSDMLNWTFANTYWVSAATGRVWRSIQHIHPDMDALEIEILRPPLSQN